MTTEATATAPETTAPITPQEFLASIAGAPTADQVAAWKQQAPNNDIEIYTPDGKRVFIVRGVTGLELSQKQKQVQAMATPSADPDLEVKLAVVALATVWTNVGTNGKLTDVVLRTGSAGLPDTLFTIITDLSDFKSPVQIENGRAKL